MSKEDLVGAEKQAADNFENLLRSKGAYLVFQELRIQWQNEQARRGLEWAKIGDWDALARHIREGGKITNEIARFVVDVLEGKRGSANKARKGVRRPANRAQTNEARDKLVGLVCRVHESMKSRGLNQSAAIDELAEQERISRRTVERALGRRVWALEAAKELLADEFLKFIPNALRAGHLKSKRYTVCDAGLSSWQGATGSRQDGPT
jgi:hypothetical protein